MSNDHIPEYLFIYFHTMHGLRLNSALLKSIYMTETFAYLAGRASMHKTIIRRSQFSKRTWLRDDASQKERSPKDNQGIIICR